MKMLGSKLTSKGQMTLPKEIRDYLDLQPGDRVVFIRKDGEVVIQGVKETLLDLRGSVKARQHAEDFNSVRQHVKRRVAQKAARE
ncbi:AbrB/MazE/SpoVT family DNA-binding domain-containing protein [Candidatus Acetothermia bacterium]|nr:AbrB/MazE/SpoVT family DNA-binding domain-containing protein [Candidatus Acetothermia bacterium]